MSHAAPRVARLAARRAQTRAGIDAEIVGAVTDDELACIEAILVRAHDRAGLPYGAPLPEGFTSPDERARVDQILRAAQARSKGTLSRSSRRRDVPEPTHRARVAVAPRTGG